MSSDATIWVGPQLPAVVPSAGTIIREDQTASAGQTVFTLNTFTYTPGSGILLVFQNGVLQRVNTDYTETDGSTITLVVPANDTDDLLFVAIAVSALNIYNSVYRQIGASAIQRNVQAPILERIRVSDWNVVPGFGNGDQYSKIQACINENPGRTIWFDQDGFYLHSQDLVITHDRTALVGNGSSATVLWGTGNAIVDGVRFACATANTVNDYLNNTAIKGMTIERATAGTVGAGLRLRQCNTMVVDDVYILDYPEGYVQEGGKSIFRNNLNINLSTVTYPTYLGAGTSTFKITPAAIAGGLWQQPFTSFISNYNIGGGKAVDTVINIQNLDGESFRGGYVSAGKNALIRLKPKVNGKTISGLTFTGNYCDGLNTVVNILQILDDGFAGGSLINNVIFDPSCQLANSTGDGVLSTHPNLQTIDVPTACLFNIAGAEFNISGGDIRGGSWINLPLPWTPVLAAAVNNDLTIGGTVVQLGTMVRSGGVIKNWFRISGTLNYTTSSGAIFINGLPVGSATLGTKDFMGTLSWFGGITKAGYTNFGLRNSGAGSTGLTIQASGSGVGATTVNVADIPSGTVFVLQGFIEFPEAELL